MHRIDGAGGEVGDQVDGFPLVCRGVWGYVARTGLNGERAEEKRTEAKQVETGPGAGHPERFFGLLGRIEGEPVQAELSEVRLLLELLGFLLNGMVTILGGGWSAKFFTTEGQGVEHAGASVF